MNFKKKLLYCYIVILLTVLFLGGCVWNNGQGGNNKFFETQNLVPAETQSFASVRIGKAVVKAEVARDLESQRIGLSGRSKLGGGEGMLFVYDGVEIHSFWMKDMVFDLDIIFIKNNIVVDLAENLLLPELGEKPMSYVSKEEANYVLEVNAGFIDRYGIKVGDEVRI